MTFVLVSFLLLVKVYVKNMVVTINLTTSMKNENEKSDLKLSYFDLFE